MRRSILAFAVLLAACQPSSPGTAPSTTSGAGVAKLVMVIPANSFVVGQSVKATSTPYDATGNVLTNRVITWTSSAPAIATVTSSGTVTGVSAGTSRITTTIDGTVSTSLDITVLAPPAACSTTTAISMAVGEIRTVTGSQRSQLCMLGGSSGADYAISAINLDTGSTIRPFSMLPAGTQGTGTPLAPSLANLVVPATTEDPTPRRLHVERLRNMRRFLGTRLSAARGQGAFPSSNIKGLAATPTVGTIVRLNTNGDGVNGNPCVANTSDYHGARVAAVTTRAIVIVDTLSPSGGLSDAELQSIATTFDTLVYNTDVAAFGAPYDSDLNGRVILFFTPGVNALTPASANFVIGGFFDSRDLYASTGANACAGSNEGEMFYLPVLDSLRRYNNAYTSRASLVKGVINTLGHEFQHLINWSRRLNITGASAPEDLFLDEGLSHYAEELLYYRASGFSAGTDINFSRIAATPATQTDYITYQEPNMGRLLSFMANPSGNSAWADNDSLATRGATWALLRYMIDQSPLQSTAYTQALVNSNRQGLDNLNFVFGNVFTSPYAAGQGLAMSLLTDGSTVPVPTLYAFRSWDLRTIMPREANTPTVYPLAVAALAPGTTRTYNMAAGGMAFARFSVGVGGAGTITLSSGADALHTPITLQIVRTK
jgi:hypothetical protein